VLDSPHAGSRGAEIQFGREEPRCQDEENCSNG
jgi:hypothetical protein